LADTYLTNPDSTPSSSPVSGTEESVRALLGPAQGPDEMGRLGPYRVLRVLGAGGMGVVFEAEDPQLKRRIALKAMRPALLAQGDAQKRFLLEAQRMAALAHDHVIAIHHVGEDRGVSFLVMPLLQGESLEDRLRREGKLPLSEVLRIGRETALGLAAAHERGLIHRDVKPANLWLEAPSGRVKVLDFGLARLAGGDARLTGSGVIVGTPSYMAPEQAEGEVDARADLFSLGCVLYRMVTGRLPFPGKTAMAALREVAILDPPPPRQVNPETPEALSQLIMRLLSKDPAGRPASAAAVVQALEEIQRIALAPKLPDAAKPQAEKAVGEQTPGSDSPSTPVHSPPAGQPPAPRPARRKRFLWVSAAGISKANSGPEKRAARRKQLLWISTASLLLAGTLTLAGLVVPRLFHSPTTEREVVGERPFARPTPQIAPHPDNRETIPQDDIAKSKPLPPMDPPRAKLQVLSLEVERHATVNGKRHPRRHVLGDRRDPDSFLTHCDDGVEVKVRLSRPAYAFLIAFRPDGSELRCLPEKEDKSPPLTDQLRYPPSETEDYGLEEGAGLYAFAVVVSSQPLAAWKEWWSREGCPWRHIEAPPDGVWRAFDGKVLEELTFDPSIPRGKRDVPVKAAVRDLAKWLLERPRVEALEVVAFPVIPAEQGKKGPPPKCRGSSWFRKMPAKQPSKRSTWRSCRKWGNSTRRFQ
jgi:serine/threonine protein kinase